MELNQGSPEAIVGSMAAMARAVDLPSRVVVGYGPGELADGRNDLWVVHGRDTTTWVELNINGLWQMYDPAPVGSAAIPRSDTPPVMNRDHWHAIFAIYDCNSGEYLPPLMSTDDPAGIHSHQDGLIHIHPWFESSAGENAKLRLYFDTMGVEVGADRIVAAEDGIDISATEACAAGSVLHLRKWAFDFQLDIGYPEIFTGNIGDVRFLNDREVYVLALAPIDAELPPMPDELFAGLNAQTLPNDSAPGAANVLESSVEQRSPAPVDPNAPILYVIQVGDSPEAIADAFDVSVADIVAANPFEDIAALQPGDVLRLPSLVDGAAPE